MKDFEKAEMQRLSEKKSLTKEENDRLNKLWELYFMEG